MADLQMQKMIELQRECRSETGIEKGAPLVPTRFILWLVERVQKLEQCSVVRCKELLVQMFNDIQKSDAEKELYVWHKGELKSSLLAIKIVLQVIEERQAL